MPSEPCAYQERTYRNNILKNNLKTYNVTVRETDLFISTDIDLTEIALSSILKYRSFIETYSLTYPEFLTSLTPLKYNIYAPEIVREMMRASSVAGVGPMAAVAGAISEYVGRDLLVHSQNVIIENGGDIFIRTMKDVRIGIFAGESPLNNRLSLRVRTKEMPMGICTSSGTVGHSLSFGCADAVCVKSGSVSIADSTATAIGNIVKSKKDIRYALEEGMKIDHVLGIVIVIDDQMGAIGDIELSGL